MKKLFVIFAAIALVGAFAATTMAADWSFYGSSRMATYYQSYDKDASGTGDSEASLDWSQQGNSRIGGRVQANDALLGAFEYGIYDDNRVRNRLLYARWSFSENGYLLLGQSYTPVSYWVGAQVYAGDAGLIGWGAPYGGREDQIKVVVAGFQLAAIKNTQNNTYDTMLPKLEARYDFAFGDHSLGVYGGYQGYTTAADEDYTSYMYGLGYTGAFGPAWVNAAVTGGTNMANAGWGGTYTNPAITEDEDTTTMMFAVAAGMAASEKMAFEAGFGYTAEENDDFGSDTDTNMALYVNMTYTVAPGFKVIPEIGYIDMMKDMNDDDEGNMFYAGAKWQMDF